MKSIQIVVASLFALTGCQATLSPASLLSGGKGGGPTAQSEAGSGSSEASTPKKSGFAAECSKYTDAQKQEARAKFGKAPPEFSKDIEQLGRYDGYYDSISNSTELAVKQLAAFPADWKRVQDVPEKYGAYMCARRDEDGHASMMERRYYDAKPVIEKFKKLLDEWAQKAPKQLDDELGKAVALMEKAKAVPTAQDENGRSLLGDSTSTVRFTMRNAELLVMVLETAQGREAPAAKKARGDWEKTQDKLASINEEIANLIVEKTDPPKDVYAGGDKGALDAAIRNAWKGHYPTDKVLRVYFTQKDWERKSGAQWMEATHSIQSYDNSWLAAAVAVKVDDKVAEIWRVDLRKDHLDGGKLKTDYVFKDARVKLGKVLVKKIK